MTRLIKVIPLFAGFVMAVLAFNASAQSDIAEIYIAEMSKIADALSTIDDEASAREAAREIAKSQIILEEVAERANAMDDMEKAMVFQNHAQEMGAVHERFSTAMRNLLQHPELFSIISDEMNSLPEIK